MKKRGEMMDAERLKVNVSITDTDIFLNMMNVLSDFMKDERIPVEVRTDYEDKIISVAESSGYCLERK